MYSIRWPFKACKPRYTEFVPEEIVDKFKLCKENQRVEEAGRRPALAKTVLLSITKAHRGTPGLADP
jgi:hypothetical protein